MEARRQPRTEEEFFEDIFSFGSNLFDLKKELDADRRLPGTKESLIKEIQSTLGVIKELVDEVCEKFNIIHPNNCPEIRVWSKGNLPPIPEGKNYYWWKWYEDLNKKYTTRKYNDLICSACPMSSGEDNYVNLKEVPCSLLKGTSLEPGCLCDCALISSSVPGWNQKLLLNEIRSRGGYTAVRKFVKKEKELSKRFKM